MNTNIQNFCNYHRWLISATMLLGLCSFLLIGCSDETVEQQPDVTGANGTACEPLSDLSDTIALEDIIAVGEDSEGSLYVVDERTDGTGQRAFVSDGDTLYRQEVIGSGGSSDSILLVIQSSDEDTSTLLIEIDSEGAITMAIVRGEQYEGPITDMGENGELLEVQDENIVSGMAVQDIAGDQLFYHYATVDNGYTLLITVPNADWQGEDHEHLYYGTEGELLERSISEFGVMGDGGSTTIVFDVGGETAEASFPVGLWDEDPEWETATLTVGNETLEVNRQEPEEFNATDYAFFCLTE